MQLKTMRIHYALTPEVARLNKQLLMMSWVFLLQSLFPIATLADDFTAGNAAALIAAIHQANANGVADTITLTDNITLVAVDNVVEGNNGLPLVTSLLTIEGQGFTIQRSPAAVTDAFRIFYVAPTGRLTLHQVAIANGLVSLATSASAAGGGLFN